MCLRMVSAVTVSLDAIAPVSALTTTNELPVSMTAFDLGGRLRISLVRITDHVDLCICLPMFPPRSSFRVLCS